MESTLLFLVITSLASSIDGLLGEFLQEKNMVHFYPIPSEFVKIHVFVITPESPLQH